MPIPSPAPFGLLQPLKLLIDGGPISEDTPVHLMVPVDARRAVLVSIGGSGDVMVSDPYCRMPVIRAGKFKATTPFGAGPLSFVDLHADGHYYGMDFPVPTGPHRSIAEIIKATCSCLSRPCPSRYRHEDGASALQQPDESCPKGLLKLNTTKLVATTTVEAESTCPYPSCYQHEDGASALQQPDESSPKGLLKLNTTKLVATTTEAEPTCPYPSPYRHEDGASALQQPDESSPKGLLKLNTTALVATTTEAEPTCPYLSRYRHEDGASALQQPYYSPPTGLLKLNTTALVATTTVEAAPTCPYPSRYHHEDGASALQQSDDSFPKGLLNTTALGASTTMKVAPMFSCLGSIFEATPTLDAMWEAAPTFAATSSTCPHAQAVTPWSPMSPILAHLRRDWGLEYYIRVDRGGSFHTYPDMGGPFQSMQQAENAIDRYLHGRRDSTMCMERAGVSQNEMGRRQCLFWPDGTRKKRTKSYIFKKGLEHISRLVCAIVDQYNEDHNLLGDLAYILKDIVRHQSFNEKDEWYRHLNFTAEVKGANGLDWFEKLFFVELKNAKQEGSHGVWVVSCFCMVDPTDDGHCRGCQNGVRHPNKADAFAGGHVDADEMHVIPAEWSDSDEDDSSRERRIRRMYEGRKPFVFPAWAVLKESA